MLTAMLRLQLAELPENHTKDSGVLHMVRDLIERDLRPAAEVAVCEGHGPVAAVASRNRVLDRHQHVAVLARDLDELFLRWVGGLLELPPCLAARGAGALQPDDRQEGVSAFVLREEDELRQC